MAIEALLFGSESAAPPSFKERLMADSRLGRQNGVGSRIGEHVGMSNSCARMWRMFDGWLVLCEGGLGGRVWTCRRRNRLTDDGRKSIGGGGNRTQ